MVRIVLHKFGDVEERFVNEIMEVMNGCYNCIDTHTVEIVDLYLFDKSSKMNAFISEEKRKMGIETSPFEESFFAVHDAWHGTPRIMVAYDKALDLPKMVRTGGLRHEVAHTILHGSLEYYSFTFPTCLLKLENDGIISRQTMRDLLYLTSIAVKDCEVTRLLYQKGYVEDQVAYNKFFLEPSLEDHEAWQLAKNNKVARLLVLISLLKISCCAAPLLKNEKYDKEMFESITRNIEYLPTELSKRLLRLVESSSEFGDDTHQNVDLFIKKIIDELVIRGEYFNTKN